MQWIDRSSYSQGQKVRVPSVWFTKIGDVEVTVHRHIYYDGWLVSSRTLGIDKKDLNILPIEASDEAKKAGLEYVHSFIEKQIDSLRIANTLIKEELDKE